MTYDKVETETHMKIKKEFIWDYSFTDADYETEAFKKWYISRVLVRGNKQDIQDIGHALIREYLPQITLPARLREYWEWLLQHHDIHSGSEKVFDHSEKHFSPAG